MAPVIERSGWNLGNARHAIVDGPTAYVQCRAIPQGRYRSLRRHVPYARTQRQQWKPAPIDAAVRVLAHKAELNGYALDPEQSSGVFRFSINIHLGRVEK